jgi:(S)-2-hydroxyglutarate dehydrogenase
MQAERSDYLIIGGGIMGLAVARALRASHPAAAITLIDKESDVACHASGRNSGVLHAGFYYGADSLKAKFCRDGNADMRAYVAAHNLRINDCKKVVVAQSEDELPALHELYRRGQVNGVKLQLVDEKELYAIEPNAKTTQAAI